MSRRRIKGNNHPAVESFAVACQYREIPADAAISKQFPGGVAIQIIRRVPEPLPRQEQGFGFHTDVLDAEFKFISPSRAIRL
jgi:hypothetical protein